MTCSRYLRLNCLSGQLGWTLKASISTSGVLRCSLSRMTPSVIYKYCKHSYTTSVHLYRLKPTLEKPNTPESGVFFSSLANRHGYSSWQIFKSDRITVRNPPFIAVWKKCFRNHDLKGGKKDSLSEQLLQQATWVAEPLSNHRGHFRHVFIQFAQVHHWML